MYKILGGDGKEYGPISADTVRQWIREGRANAQTQVQAEGATAWVALGQLAEFASAFTPSSGAPSIIYPAGPSPEQASQAVAGPAIGLIVTAAIGALWQVSLVVMNLLGVGAGMMGANHDSADMPAWVHGLSGGIGVVVNVVGLIVSVVIILGALKMKKLESYNFAMTATIVAMVPCISPCCLLGLPIGIWAMVVLLKPEVKGAFKSGV